MRSSIPWAMTRDAAFMLLSNFIAQAISARGGRFDLDHHRLLRFATCAALIAPTKVEWVEDVESSLPVIRAERSTRENPTLQLQRTDVYNNTVVKVLLSEALRGIWYASELIILMWLFRGEADSMALVCKSDAWPVFRAHLMFWPLFSVFKYVVIPAKRRPLVSGLGDIIWGVWLSLVL